MADVDSHTSAMEHPEETSSAEHSGGEGETFEDAADSTPVNRSPTDSPSTRSLTGRPSSPGSNRTASPELQTIPSEPVVEEEQKEVSQDASRGSSPESPLTSRRISTTSDASLDSVELGGDSTAETPRGSESSKQGMASRNKPAALLGLSGALPSGPWSPPPSATATATSSAPPPVPSKAMDPPPPPPPTRTLTSPFSWLSRKNNASKEAPLPTIPQKGDHRRDTVSSIATISSNPELMLSKLEEGQDTHSSGRRGSRNSLRDRFKQARLREEVGIEHLPEEEKTGGGLASMVGRLADNGPISPAPISPNPISINPSLAPGTASGVSAGPSALADPSAPVDWDLWQSVVYEGPAAVARSSAEELNKAIATGIPHAIRGVVWQVLAHSKNEELEHYYRVLLTRGTDKDEDRKSYPNGTASANSSGKEKDSVKSSASSVHSDQSTPPTTTGMRSPSPHEKDAEGVAKAQALSQAERKKKAKEDADALKKLEKAIKRDLGARTSYSKYAAASGMQEGLFGICKAYALYDQGVGYAQGMNFLVMPLLFNMPEEEAFSLLVRLMNQYHLRELFIQDMPGLHKHLYQFERLLEDLEPALYCHLHRRQVTPHLYATQWFLTLFAYRFPLQLVLRIYDLILSEGLEAILKFGIVLMQKNASTLLGINDMSQLTTFLKDRLFDVYIDQSPSAGSILESGFFGSSGASIDKEIYRADMLVQDACAVKITPEILKAYEAEWEEKTKAEAAREAELQDLKTANASLALKVRSLEERVQEHDSEHAALATELVRTKVENEELRDQNEGLETQNQELKDLVERQPAEVEAKLKEEMDRVIKRNQEVQEANTKLEDEMAEMEQTLVATKMQYAEINAQHEALTRKWTDLRKALDN